MKSPRRGSSSESGRPIVAVACWLDLLGYGEMMDAAGFDPSHPAAKRPLARLRAFHRVVSAHSGGLFPTLVMNDGAVAYGSLGLLPSGRLESFLERCWRLYQDATAVDRRGRGPGLRAVVAVGLRARGSARGIQAQEEELTGIIEAFAAERINKVEALAAVRKVRRVFDVVPALQANFAFARAYEAERAGSRAGLTGPGFYLDTAVFRAGVPDWILAEPPIDWRPKRASLLTTFVSVGAMGEAPEGGRRDVFRDGRELLSLLRRER